MSYTAWETSAGEALKEVEAYCRHAARGTGGTFGPTTAPTKVAVERWLTVSYHWIRGQLSGSGLSAAQTDASVLAVLQELNVVDVAIRVEMSLPEEGGTGEPNQRFLQFVERRKELLEMFTDGSLSDLGAASGTVSRAPIIGGERYSRKTIAEDDIDRTQHRIRRGLFTHPGTLLPSSEQDWHTV